MILEYSYDKLNEVISLFKENKIALLNITKDTNNNTFLMDYILFDDLTETQKDSAMSLYIDSFTQRVKTLELLNKFLEAQVTNSTQDFNLKFSVAMVQKCELIYGYSFKNNSSILVDSNEKQFKECAEKLLSLIVDMGITESTVDDLYIKEGMGKGKKYKPCMIKDLVDKLNTIVE